MSVQYTVTVPEYGTTPVFQMGDQNPGVTVKNTGDVDVLLAQTSAVTETNGYVLSPGSSVVWVAGRALFIGGVADGKCFISDNSGNLFDANAVAVAIMNEGLADAIAGEISLKGAPPIRQSSKPFDIKPSFSGSGVPSGDGSQTFTTEWFDVSTFDMINVRIDVTSFPAAHGSFSVFVRFQETATGDIELSPLYESWYGACIVVTPCASDLAQVVVSNNGAHGVALTPFACVLDIELTTGGSVTPEYRSVPSIVWTN